MSETAELRELLRALTEGVAENLSYLRELGLEGLEGAGSFEVPKSAEQPKTARETLASPTPKVGVPQSSQSLQSLQSPRSPALARNAGAEQRSRPPIPKVPTTTSTRADNPAQPTNEQTEMAKRTTRKQAAPDTPAPRETLFGEITPMDEASLPRRDETLEDIRADIGECIRCPLSQSRTHVVHSEGNRQARLMFVGEAPGADEDASGRPFVGRAGQLLNKIIEAIGLKREDVFIGNVNRCRPPQNRTPTLEEAKACKGFLLREIGVVRPEVIVVLGNTAMKNLLDTKEGITKLRGQFQDYRGIKVMPTFHPAYLLRDPSKKRETWDDMKKVRDYLNQNKSGV